MRAYRITSPAPNVVRISDGDVTHQLDITLDPVSWLPARTSSISLADPVVSACRSDGRADPAE
jgi:hypothetical protein